MAQLLAWFEIAVTDLDRATKFYTDVFGSQFQTMESGDGGKMAMFATGESELGGGLVQGAQYTPGHQGTVVYFWVDGDLNTALQKVASAGGKVLLEKTAIGDDIGYFAWFEDTEGNRVGMLSQG